mmetsp:Transcript_63922/g.205958  ORF Transcript_63922/g.205958 Transcript_63922/m.205958 type:complete len:524 (+) Transcript_63922:262-1833(+)
MPSAQSHCPPRPQTLMTAANSATPGCNSAACMPPSSRRAHSHWPACPQAPMAAPHAAAGGARPRPEAREPQRKFFFGDIFKEGKYQPLHGELFGPEASGHWPTWLAPGFAAVAEAAKAGNPWPALRKEAEGVYSFELFSPEFCDLLLEEVEHAQRTAREDLERPNGMNRYGIVLNQLGLQPLITALQQEHLLTLQAALYPSEGSAADDHHCFIVRYRAGEDVGLDMHEDDADVTLNVCLGKDFTDATLSFCGQVADEDHRKLRHTYVHQKGRAVIHLGRHRHGADNIASGERVNFILWSTSGAYRASEAYQRQRLRSASASPPDPICLSYTHDRDYTEYLPRPTKAEAVARGVMLDVVERRHAIYQRPVHDLSRPLEDINRVPSVCLFLEDLPPQRQHALFTELMHLATEALEGFGERPPHQPPPLLFFVGVQPGGAVPQVRGFCGVQGSPAFAVLDVDKERVHRLPTGTEVDGQVMRRFVQDFLQGKLPSEPLGGASAPDRPAEAERGAPGPKAGEGAPAGE